MTYKQFSRSRMTLHYVIHNDGACELVLPPLSPLISGKLKNRVVAWYRTCINGEQSN